MAPSLRTLAARGLRQRIEAWATPVVQKDDGGSGIWGGAFDAFNGIDRSGGGPQDTTDQPADYARARVGEPYLFVCEAVRGRAISQVPLKCWEYDSQGRRHAIEHDAIGVLATTNPYGWVDGSALHRYTLTSLDFHGRSAWSLAFSKKGIPTEVYWLNPLAFAPVPDESKPMRILRGLSVHDITGAHEIPADQVCYFATDNPSDPLTGTSKVSVLKHPINLRAYSVWNNIAFFKNSMRPDWILAGNFSNNEENVSRIRRAVRRWLSGANNRAPLILGEGMSAHLLTTSHEDAQWVEQQRLAQEEISAVFGVPLIYLNNLEKATYDNIKTAKLILWHDTMIPEGDMMADLYNRRFLWRFWPDTRERGIAFGFDYSAIEGLGEDLALIWERVVKMSFQLSEQVRYRELTPNQARLMRQQLFGELGLDVNAFTGEVPGGDTFYERFEMLPVDQLSVQAIMDIWGMRGGNPELIESVPGAPNAGSNADDVLGRITAPKPAPPVPQISPPTAPTVLPEAQPPTPPTPPQPPPPQPAKGLEELRAEVMADLRQGVAQAVGEAAVTAFGEALKVHQVPEVDHQLERRLKRFFQDQQTDALRTLRVSQAAGVEPPADLWSRRIYEDRLTELIGPEKACEVEAATREAVRQSPNITTVFRHAIDVRASALASGQADPIIQKAVRPMEDQLKAAEEHHVSAVRDALTAALDADTIARDWLSWSGSAKAKGVSVGLDFFPIAQQFASSLGLDMKQLSSIMNAVYGDGWQLGVGGALRQLAGQGYSGLTSDGIGDIDWSAWRPGNPAAALQASGLADLLQQADVVIKGISDTTLDEIAKALAAGAASGDSLDTLARSLRDLVGSMERAELIAQTELARAVSAASLDTYRRNGVAAKGWITYQPCAICQRNEGAVISLDDVFPSGVSAPPQHPRCRCSLTPKTLAETALPTAASATHDDDLILASAAAGVELYVEAS